MRKLMALAMVLTIAGATRCWAAAGMGDITFDGSLEVSGNSANNETDFNSTNDHRGNTATRVRLGMNAEVTEGVKGRVEIIRSPSSNSAGNQALYGGDGKPTSLDDEMNFFEIHNAYIDLTLWDHLFRLGRQYVGNPGDLVWNISPTDDDSLTPNSIDGLGIQCRKFDFLHLDLFTGKALENETVSSTDAGDGGSTDTDINLSSLDATLPTIVPGGAINVGYVWGQNSENNLSSSKDTLSTIRVGIRGGAKENMITYRAEYFQNGGKFVDGTGSPDEKHKGNAIDLGVGFNPADVGIGRFNIWGNYLMGSGDDDLTDDDDDSFHDFTALGLNTSDRLFGEIFGKSNTMGDDLGTVGATPLGQGLDAWNSSTVGHGTGLTVANLGVSFNPKMSEKTSLKLDWFAFSQTEDMQGGADQGGAIGTEIDLTLGYTQSANVNVELGYAMFSPDDGITGIGSASDEDVTKLFARTKVKWGGESK